MIALIYFYTLFGVGGENNAVCLTFRFSYLPLWTEIIRILSRGGRDVAVASEHQLSDLLTAMVDFLHGARQFIRTEGTYSICTLCFIIHVAVTFETQYYGTPFCGYVLFLKKVYN